jgi:hypothetical protein
MVLALDDFNKQSRPIFDGFSKDLQEVPLLIVINQNMQFLQSIQILRYFCCGSSETQTQVLVVRLRD